MRKEIIFLIAIVFVTVNADYSQDKERKYDPISANDSSHASHLIGREEKNREWQESDLKIEGDNDVLTPLEHVLQRFARSTKFRICIGGCVNGTCEGIGKCKCKTGYVKSKNDSRVCVPSCKKDCEFGKCTDPNTCTCLDEYEPTQDRYKCKPKCHAWCYPGRCDQPWECTCHPGFILEYASCRAAVCRMPCRPLEFCARDNFCDCIDGYRKSQFSNPYVFSNVTATCQPICHKFCPTGRCETPNHCACNFGYKWNSGLSQCEPVCDNPKCVNGFTCTAPNQCGCKSGKIKEKTVQGMYGQTTVEKHCISAGSRFGLTSSALFVLIGIAYSLLYSY